MLLEMSNAESSNSQQTLPVLRTVGDDDGLQSGKPFFY